MSRHAPRTPFAARRAAPAPSGPAARQAWRALLTSAKAHGDFTAQGLVLDRNTAADFTHQVVTVCKLPFPLLHASASRARNGFVELAHGFVTASQPELKAMLGQAMAAAAACCDRMIDHALTAQADATWRRQQPDA